jgi:hypothetical protein
MRKTVASWSGVRYDGETGSQPIGKLKKSIMICIYTIVSVVLGHWTWDLGGLSKVFVGVFGERIVLHLGVFGSVGECLYSYGPILGTLATPP